MKVHDFLFLVFSVQHPGGLFYLLICIIYLHYDSEYISRYTPLLFLILHYVFIPSCFP